MKRRDSKSLHWSRVAQVFIGLRPGDIFRLQDQLVEDVFRDGQPSRRHSLSLWRHPTLYRAVHVVREVLRHLKLCVNEDSD